MSSRANDRGANQVTSPANYGNPSKEPPPQLFESSVRKKQWRSKLGTTSISKRPRCQNRRSSQGAFRKVPGAPDNARRGATQEPDHYPIYRRRICRGSNLFLSFFYLSLDGISFITAVSRHFFAPFFISGKIALIRVDNIQQVCMNKTLRPLFWNRIEC
ncbi:hypothetical protein MRX96_013108 [Rhipicephalus microplus]